MRSGSALLVWGGSGYLEPDYCELGTCGWICTYLLPVVEKQLYFGKFRQLDDGCRPCTVLTIFICFGALLLLIYRNSPWERQGAERRNTFAGWMIQWFGAAWGLEGGDSGLMIGVC